MADASMLDVMIEAVTMLNPRTKRALLVATSMPLKRRTWDGCAFNTASRLEGGDGVRSIMETARWFGLPAVVVCDFIRTWDVLTPSAAEAVALLRAALSRVGVETPAVLDEATAMLNPYRHMELYEELLNELPAFLDELYGPDPTAAIVAASGPTAAATDMAAAPAIVAEAAPSDLDMVAALLGVSIIESEQALTA